MDRFRSILVVADEATWSDAVRERAVWLARSNGATITLADLQSQTGGEVARILDALNPERADTVRGAIDAARRQRLEGLAEAMRAPDVAVDTVTLTGTPFLEIIRKVLRDGHDLVLKGAHRGPDRPALRAPDLHLLRKCPCPVWVINGGAGQRASRIVAAVDPGPEDPVRGDLARQVMQLATSLAARDDAQLDVLNAWQVAEEAMLRHGRVNLPEHEIIAILNHEEAASRRALDALVDAFPEARARMRVLHLKGNPDDVIPEHVQTEAADTLVMGTVGRTGIAGFFIGNTAETVLNRVDCSVLAVKPPGFQSPVTVKDS